ncbi:DUF2061 domain-containing protein [Erythrobacteraceae bacterium CFH 75059]|nr:DUF2061 domain-containing protein [Erythrobacteraceae bacterium CFH 75059]
MPVFSPEAATGADLLGRAEAIRVRFGRCQHNGAALTARWDGHDVAVPPTAAGAGEIRTAPVPRPVAQGGSAPASSPSRAPAEAGSAEPWVPPRWLVPFGRDFTKTLTFLALHLLVGFTVAYVFTGSVAIASGIALVEPLVNAVVFFFHEKAWRRSEVPLLDIMLHRHTRTGV